MVIAPGTPGDTFPTGAIEPGTPFGVGLRSVALDIDRAAGAILRRDLAFAPDSVHALRVSTKQLRAFWQLLRPVVGKEAAAQSVRDLRDSARVLAPVRDEYVLRMLLAELATTPGGVPQSEIEEAAALLPHVPSIGPEAGRQFLGVIEADARTWGGLPPVRDEALLDAGLRRSFEKTRQLGLAAFSSWAPEDLHRWRRWVKYLRYQLEPLARQERRFIAAGYAELKLLGSVLGERNDLQNLRQALRFSELPSLSTALEARDLALEAATPSLADTVLDLSADDFLAPIRRELGL